MSQKKVSFTNEQVQMIANAIYSTDLEYNDLGSDDAIKDVDSDSLSLLREVLQRLGIRYERIDTTGISIIGVKT